MSSFIFKIVLNITQYYLSHGNDKCRTQIRRRTHKRHLIARPYGRAMGCLLWVLWETNRKISTVHRTQCSCQKTWRRHEMETLSVLLALYTFHRWIPLTKGQACVSFDAFFISSLLASSCSALGHLRNHDASVMSEKSSKFSSRQHKYQDEFFGLRRQ